MMSEPRTQHRWPPGPRPKVRWLSELAVGVQLATRPLAFVRRRFDEYGDIFCTPGGPFAHYVVFKPEHAWEVLVRDALAYDKGHAVLKQLELVTGRGLVTASGDEWRRQRRLAQPAFSPARMAAYGDMMVAETARTADGWPAGDEIAVDEALMSLTMRMVCRMLFGVDLRQGSAQLRQPLITIQRSMGVPGLVPMWLPGSPARRMARARRQLDAFIRQTLNERRATGQPSQGRGSDDLLQSLLDGQHDCKAALSDQQICDQLLTMFFAGHETTANALAWTLHLLGRHPDAEARWLEEVDSRLPDRDPTIGDVAALPWTRQCFEEAMRLYPPAFCIFRRAVEDTTLAGYRVPAGSQVDVWTYFTHRVESCYQDPEAFRPERFGAAGVAALPRCAYLPFGAGMRTCIGKGLSMLAGTLILATLARRFRFIPKTREPAIPRIEVTLAPGPLPMLLQPRGGRSARSPGASNHQDHVADVAAGPKRNTGSADVPCDVASGCPVATTTIAMAAAATPPPPNPSAKYKSRRSRARSASKS